MSGGGGITREEAAGMELDLVVSSSRRPHHELEVAHGGQGQLGGGSGSTNLAMDPRWFLLIALESGGALVSSSLALRPAVGWNRVGRTCVGARPGAMVAEITMCKK
jgi:hypothetical protein